MFKFIEDKKMQKRKKTKVKLLIEVLRDGAWHLGDELAVTVGHRFGDAVKKARWATTLKRTGLESAKNINIVC